MRDGGDRTALARRCAAPPLEAGRRRVQKPPAHRKEPTRSRVMAFAGMVSTFSLKPFRVTEVDVQAVVPAGIVQLYPCDVYNAVTSRGLFGADARLGAWIILPSLR